MKIWEAPEDIRNLVGLLKEQYHQHLALAKIWVLVSDAKHIVDNQLVVTTSARCTKTEKLRTGNDFKIVVIADGWHLMTDHQRRVAVDEALCRCGVHYIPMVQKVNKKDEIIKDEIGRTIFTDTIATDDEGQPKWKVNKLDAGAYYQLLQRHGRYSEGIENIISALDGKPLKLPVAAVQPDAQGSSSIDEDDSEAGEVEPDQSGETDAETA
jgi:hypothetical protein